MLYPFEYRKLGDFTYHVIPDPPEIKKHVMKWILREWKQDHEEAPHEQWTVEWMNIVPDMDFELQILGLEQIHPRRDLMSVKEFQVELRERADDREWSILRGVSIEPLLINRNGYELMDGYTRYAVLEKFLQHEVYAYVGHI